jgi:hypothetical protein
MGLIELLNSLQTADKLAAVLKSSRTDVREKSARNSTNMAGVSQG